MVFDIRGTEHQRSLVEAALARCDFPFERLTAGLRQQWNKDTISVEWADLDTTSSVVLEVGRAGRAHRVKPNVESRDRVLGTAWTDGRIYIDYSCESDPELAAEVFLSEAAHQVDFFYLTDDDREAIWDIYHDAAGDIGDHGHNWFDEGAYETWVGESLMAGFTRAYSDVHISLSQFTHVTTDEVARELREAITPELGPPPWGAVDPEPEPEPTPEPPKPEWPKEPEPSMSLFARILQWLRGFFYRF